MGVDLGGTKIELAVYDEEGKERLRQRKAGARCSVGIGMPGAISPRSGRVFNAFNTPFNGRRLKQDLEEKLGREVRFENDANCFALSEATDGAGRGASVVFGAILGTGAGGGIVVEGRVIRGHNAIGGEWGHTPLPWMTPEEYPGPPCYCGRRGCIEQFVAGPALKREIAARGEELANELHEDRLARAFSMVVNVLDPDVIVLGGGLSNIQRLYTTVLRLLPKYVYAQTVDTAAMLWG